MRGKVDELVGLKENVIIGWLIPAGTGFVKPEFVPRFEHATATAAVKPVESESTLGTLFKEEMEQGSGAPSDEASGGDSSGKPKKNRKKTEK